MLKVEGFFKQKEREYNCVSLQSIILDTSNLERALLIKQEKHLIDAKQKLKIDHYHEQEIIEKQIKDLKRQLENS